jgi:tRNA(fMet)-specific endonuclease VapC
VILDTNVLSAIVAGRGPAGLRERVQQATGPIYTTAVNWGEVCYGFSRHPAGAQQRAVYEREILPFLGMLDYTAECAEIYGALRGRLAGRGDLVIASIALRHDLTLVTGNTRHFSRVPGLRVENWLTDD